MMFLIVFQPFIAFVSSKPLNLLDGGSFRPVSPNYCNNSTIMLESGLIRANMGQFLGYECSSEFFQCRWESDGFRTYRKRCTAGPTSCNSTSFHCSQSEQCVPLSKRCDGRYDCSLEEDEQNCLCGNGLFHCAKSDECIPKEQRCDGIRQCPHGEDELLCKRRAANRRFTCLSLGEYIPMTQVCDGVPQCNDSSDELYCNIGIGIAQPPVSTMYGESTTNIVTSGTVQFSTSTARPSTMLNTSKVGRVTSLKPKPTAEVTDGKSKHYMITPDENGKEKEVAKVLEEVIVDMRKVR
ncbi:unnamed protein product [Angiostrongylus costaricensis]|uniref:Low-density lipoprotein receptor domain class A n=1 Tax=Angiostrongylus costaricensis TaxID=334426 RepID=A0A0R3PCJ9_ANGCS|nr:unnamed protein product [Angiostrongylus costaricensis]